MKKLLTLVLSLSALAACAQKEKPQFTELYRFDPRTYVAYRVENPITIDGDITDAEWQNAPWTEDFADIRGTEYEDQPKYRTRAKILWDDTYLYIAAELEEPHIWGTMTERESTIYWDNDFEVFIDPDNDTHNYTEFEMNALGTEWDLLMYRPYYRKGPYDVSWNIKDMKSAVRLYGTINDPSDIDQKWTVEIAFPIKSLIDTVFNGRVLGSAEQWRINFSRVEWLKVSVEDGKYVKHPGTNKFNNEENWVWNPTGRVDMHRPEHWGYLQFSDKIAGQGTEEFRWDPNEDIKFGLRTLLYRQMELDDARKSYATSIEELQPETVDTKGVPFKPVLYPDGRDFIISAPGTEGTSLWSIDAEGKVYKEDKK